MNSNCDMKSGQSVNAIIVIIQGMCIFHIHVCFILVYFRQVLYHLNSKKILATSSARSKIDIKSDRSRPLIDVLFGKYYRINSKY